MTVRCISFLIGLQLENKLQLVEVLNGFFLQDLVIALPRLFTISSQVGAEFRFDILSGMLQKLFLSLAIEIIEVQINHGLDFTTGCYRQN